MALLWEDPGAEGRRLEMSLLPQEHKGFSRVEPDTYSPLLLLLDKAPESSLGTNPTPFHSPLFFPSFCHQSCFP